MSVIKYPYAGHDAGIVITQPRAGEFQERPMTAAELAAREPAMAIAKDIYRHANQAGVCYYEFWELIAKAIDTQLATAQASILEMQKAQPVAWRMRTGPDRDWRYLDYPPAGVARDTIVEPLYAAPVASLSVQREQVPDATTTFEERCPDGQKCGATTTGCRVGQCQRARFHRQKSIQMGEKHAACPDPDQRCQHGDDINCPNLNTALPVSHTQTS